ncbi:MAG: DegT/DnrJ/EryC1/StrS family aminotransferase [bacterium]|nr:DegT/DnrJ/EryC1/StrS family aminotransferase [bacterium]
MMLPLATETWDEAEFSAMQRVIVSRQYTMGREVRAFEEELSALLGVQYAVMVNSGSSANLLAVAGLVYHPDALLRRGDTVIVPGVSWSTTYFPLSQYGMRLRFVDVHPETLNIDPDLLEEAITPDVRGIFAVNLLGNPCAYGRLLEICDRYGLVLLEDNCESLGARLNGRYTGTFGLCGTLSTFFSHHISTMEGGVLLTDDKRLYHTLLSLRAHGWTREQPPDSHLAVDIDTFMAKFRFVLPGYNVRPLEISGAIGREQLKKLPRLVEARRRNAAVFTTLLGERRDVRIQREEGSSSWFGLAIILRGSLAGRRNEVVERLDSAGIESRPIVAGDFTCNPVIRHLDHEIPHPLVVSQEIDRDGLFVGNHHYPIDSALTHLCGILDELSAGSS